MNYDEYLQRTRRSMGPRTMLPLSKDEQLTHRLEMNEYYASLLCRSQRNCSTEALMAALWVASAMKNRELTEEIMKLRFTYQKVFHIVVPSRPQRVATEHDVRALVWSPKLHVTPVWRK